MQSTFLDGGIYSEIAIFKQKQNKFCVQTIHFVQIRSYYFITFSQHIFSSKTFNMHTPRYILQRLQVQYVTLKAISKDRYYYYYIALPLLFLPLIYVLRLGGFFLKMLFE